MTQPTEVSGQCKWIRSITPFHRSVAIELSNEKDILNHFEHLNIFLRLNEENELGKHSFQDEDLSALYDLNLTWSHLFEYLRKILEHLKALHREGFVLLDFSPKQCWVDRDNFLYFSRALKCRRMDEWGKVITFQHDDFHEECGWEQDLVLLGKLLQDLARKIKKTETHEAKIKEGITQLIEQLNHPVIQERGQSISEVIYSLKKKVSDVSESEVDAMHELEDYLDLVCGNRKKHRTWCMRKLISSSRLNFDWEKGWSFQAQWEAFILPEEVSDEIVEGFVLGALEIDEKLKWMACSKRGLPLRTLSELGLPKIMEDPLEALEPWLSRHVLSIDSDRCVWGNKKLYEGLMELIPQESLKPYHSKVLSKLKDNSENDLSMMSQVISLVHEQKSKIVKRDLSQLWKIHFKAMKKYLWLQDWNSALATSEWLWLNKGHLSQDLIIELALDRIDCWLNLKQLKMAELQLSQLDMIPDHLELNYANRYITLLLAQSKSNEALIYVKECLQKYDLPWLDKHKFFKFKAKSKDLKPLNEPEVLEWINLLKFNSGEWLHQLREFNQALSKAQVEIVSKKLAQANMNCGLLNQNEELFSLGLAIYPYAQLKANDVKLDVETLKLEWLDGAPVEVVLDKLEAWLSVPARRKNEEYKLALKLKSIFKSLVYDEPYSTKKNNIQAKNVDEVYFAIKKEWGQLYESSKDAQMINKMIDADYLWGRFLFSLSYIFCKPTKNLVHDPIWQQLKQELSMMKKVEPELAGTFLFFINFFEPVRISPIHLKKSDVDLIMGLYENQKWKLACSIFMSAVEDMARMGWLEVESSWPAAQNRYEDLGFWGMLGGGHHSWQHQKEDPLLKLLRDLSSSKDHDQRIQNLLQHLMKASGATHACCWISWGDAWLPSFKARHVDAKLDWQELPKEPELKGRRIETQILCQTFLDQFLCRIEGRSRTFVVFLANDTYRHCFSRPQYDLVSKMVEYSIEPIENELALDWSQTYLNKLVPSDHPAHEIIKEPSNLPPLEDLELKLNHLIEGLQGEKDEMSKKNKLWMQQVHEEMKKHDQLQSLGRLVASLAHEINNPNSFVKINAPMVLQLWEQYTCPNSANPLSKEFIEERIPGLLQTIEEGADRIDHLIQDLKNFARQNHEEKKVDVDMTQIIDAALRMNKKYLEQHTQNFQLNLPDKIPLIKGVPYRLEQVVVNLLHNACDALEDRSKFIKLSLNVIPKKLILTLEDEGTGMSSETLEKIFEPFYTTKDDKKGMGMGMTVIKNIVDQHDATIEVRSELNRGSIFTLSFDTLDANE